ncbi:isoprenylcysteine carboxylmethyltransferase family protein [Candidatus Dojkabacteria bacterium]|nr:isoprenylcysteine carboxylmethyltransferase family protein [Candidatus Dojkabacteria bacterium]
MRKIIKTFGNVGTLISVIMSFAVVVQLVIWQTDLVEIFQIKFLRSDSSIETATLIVSLALMLLGGSFATIAHIAFRQALSEDGKVNKIITTGPFRIVRHPFYLSLMMICFSLVLLFNSYLVLLAAIVASIFLVSESKWEEENLVKEFKEEYTKYQETTGMFFPKLL